ncbi:hypothetical protein [Pontibacter oryzae]|uniref:Uncharacterized protein n=1 Tax=Pontibacter oryzae TaxID=2304593 RepID=A0A399RT88_9BACT|nr:hypothetical protein [Pontibacter oryzae]RIJ34061.1 hypothetical protein D1627_17000 [Pontibacter oryzae]
MDAQPARSKQTIQQLYNTILPELAQHIHRNLSPVLPLFHDFHLERVIDTWTKDPAASEGEEISIENGNVQQLGLRLRLEGFQKAGAEAFDLAKDLLFRLEKYGYSIGPDKQSTWLEKEYGQRWEQSEYNQLAEKWTEDLIDTLTERLQGLSD